MLKQTECGTEDFIHQFKEIISEFDSKTLPQEPLPREGWKRLMDAGICLPAIPKRFGGRENHQEMCEIIEILSERNLPMGMYTMIVTVLFLRNVALSGTERLKEEVFLDFAENPVIGGLAFTEPNCGSNLARMETTFVPDGDGYQLSGEKHWQAFSAQADWWIICAKAPDRKDFGYFAHRRVEGGFVTSKIYESLGLKNLGYGLNEIDAHVPDHRRLEKRREGLGDAAEILCASRFSKAAMSSGFLRRIFVEADAHAKARGMGKGVLFDIDYVRYKISRIKNSYVICNSLYQHLLLNEDYYQDIADSMFASLATKVLSTELMFESAVDYKQLCGGEGYRVNADNIGAYALLDSRVYTLFDGTNDLLCQHLASAAVDEMRRRGIESLFDFIGANKYTSRAGELGCLSATIDVFNMSQAESVVFGRILSRYYGISALRHRSERLKSMPGAGLVERDSDAIALYGHDEIDASVGMLALNIRSLVEELGYVRSFA